MMLPTTDVWQTASMLRHCFPRLQWRDALQAALVAGPCSAYEDPSPSAIGRWFAAALANLLVTEADRVCRHIAFVAGDESLSSELMTVGLSRDWERVGHIVLTAVWRVPMAYSFATPFHVERLQKTYGAWVRAAS